MALEEMKPEALFAICAAIGGVVWKAISVIFGFHALSLISPAL
jgi:hypothetical protein